MNLAVLIKYIQGSPIMITVIIIFMPFIIITPSYGQNTIPAADAGQTQTVNAGDIVTLNASDSDDPDGDSLNYRWSQVAGKNVILSDTHIVNPTFTAPTVNSVTPLKFTLVVDDGIFSSPPSSVVIIVNPLQKSSAAAPSYTNSSQSKQSSSNNLVAPILFILLLLTGVLYILRRGKRSRKRRDFPKSVVDQKLRDQNHKCAICKRSAGVWDYDHIDGNTSNNKPRNLQVLCPNCHAKKTRGLLKQEKRSSFLRWLTIAAIIILLFFIVWRIIAK